MFSPKNRDEMCNFYLMFYTDYTGKIQDTFCFNDAQEFSWSKNLLNAPGIIS